MSFDLTVYLESLKHHGYSPTLGLEHEGFLLREDKFWDSKDDLYRHETTLAHEAAELCKRSRPDIKALGLNIEEELTRYSFELNGFIAEDSVSGLEAIGDKLSRAVAITEAHAKMLYLKPSFVGISPFLRKIDLETKALKVSARVQRLESAWQEEARRYKTKPELFRYQPTSIAVTGCCASSQFHRSLPIKDSEAVKVWNAAHIATIPLIALSANSGTFLGKPAFAETRNLIWAYLDDLKRGRVFFGPRVKRSMAEVIRYYENLPELPLNDKCPESSLEQFQNHCTSIWPFIRLILAADHWRIENRAIASNNPTDTIANFAAYIGLMEVADELETLLCIGAEDDLFPYLLAVSEKGLDFLAERMKVSPIGAQIKLYQLALSGLVKKGYNEIKAAALLEPILLRRTHDRQLVLA